MNTDENAPAIIPVISGNVNSLIYETPMMKIINTITNVVKVV